VERKGGELRYLLGLLDVLVWRGFLATFTVPGESAKIKSKRAWRCVRRNSDEGIQLV
jgi:hypothetical protein